MASERYWLQPDRKEWQLALLFVRLFRSLDSITGGRGPGEPVVSEQHLLDLEREAFLSLCGMPKTQDRIQFMLKNGKPLRN
jgi:hypothetical protein